MRFKLHYEDEGEACEEVIDKDIPEEAIEKWCKDTLDSFNASLKPGESERTYLDCTVLGPSEVKLTPAEANSHLKQVTIDDTLYGFLPCDCEAPFDYRLDLTHDVAMIDCISCSDCGEMFDHVELS